MALQLGNDTRQERAIRLFSYLKELTELSSKSIRTIDQFERVLWLSDIPTHPSVTSVFDGAAGDRSERDSWLEVRKVRPLAPPPSCPAELVPWLSAMDVANSSLETLNLLEQIPRRVERALPENATNGEEFEYATDHPELRTVLQQFMRAKWLPWAEQDRRERKVKNAYDTLFSAYQTQQRSGELFEIVLGLGLLTWQPPGVAGVQRHLITIPASVLFDPANGTISLVPGDDGTQPMLEQDMLDPELRPDPKEELPVRALLDKAAESNWDKNALVAALTAWVNAVSADGHFRDDPLPMRTRNVPHPVVQFAPALILRKRSERSLLRFLGEALEQLEAGGVVPDGILDLIETSDQLVIDDTAYDESSRPQSIEGEIYFPLEANEEQREILNRLAHQQGVLVQGPPGTGKSHTIANLIAHLLATGQRVLVTSHTPKALRVLKEKIPSEIRSLCVSLAGTDKTAIAEVEDSVLGITQRYESFDVKRQRKLISELEERLDQQRRTNAETAAQLRALRERETYSHTLGFGNYAGTAQQIAQRLASEDAELGWIPDKVSPECEAPFTDSEAAGFLDMLRGLDASRVLELESLQLSSEDIPLPEEFEEFVRRERDAHARSAEFAAWRQLSVYERLRSMDRQERHNIEQHAQELRESFARLRDRFPQTGKRLFAALDAGEYRALRQLREDTRDALTQLGSSSTVAQASVVGIDGIDRNKLLQDATARLAHLRSGGGKGNLLSRPKVIKETDYLQRSVFVDGVACGDIPGLERLVLWIDTERLLDRMRDRWNPYESLGASSIGRRIDELVELQDAIEGVLSLWERSDLFLRTLEPSASSVSISWETDRYLQEVLTGLEALRLEEQSLHATAAFERAMTAVTASTDRHPVIAQLSSAVRVRNPEHYREAFDTIATLDRDRQLLALRNQLTERLTIDAPMLTEQLLSTYPEPVWDERMIRFQAAWDHARANSWAGDFERPGLLPELLKRLEIGQREERAILRRLAAEMAWLRLFERMTREQIQHLRAWSLAVRKIGKGKGKYAARHRRHAREHMEACRPAIPAWIMPIYRVTETLHPKLDAFDVVIIDEASQSGPEAIFLQYIAKKIVVVGDDKQISPTSFTDQESVNIIRRRLILDLPHSETLGVDNSFFDQAVIRYPGRVQLREHFRCMPEIIQFSNNLSYASSPLIPLRQYGTDRLEPVRTVHVKDGYESSGPGSQEVNIPEAEAIVRQIVTCCIDPRYDGKTLGVISLLGSRQQKVIEDRLREVLPPEEIARRRLDCGGPYDFQGDERDVIFLSLVVAPAKDGERPKPAQTKESDKRRFNVAASRARDQLWLFHSVTLNDLKNPDDVRRKLLEYCLDPHVESDPFEFPNSSVDELVAPFESLFEQHVFLRIRNRGYRVLPQVEIGPYRIDLVVEGLRGRLAVECDGDRWHGAEQYDYDIGRQRQLERAGWTFWRVSGSDFYRDPDRALAGLWETLDRLGIYPAAHVSSTIDSTGGSDGKDSVLVDALDPSEVPTVSELGEEEALTLGASDDPSEWEDDFGELDLLDLDDEQDDAEALVESKVQEPQQAPVRHGQLELIDFDEIVKPVPRTRLEREIEELKLDLDEEPASSETGLTERYAEVARSFMIPYQHWVARPLQNPYDRPSREIIAEMLEIIEAEGPVLCRRVFDLYAKAAGFESERQIRSVLNSALHTAYTQRRIEYVDEWGKPGQIDDILRSPGRSRVRLREGGGRDIEELPPSEVAEFIRLVAEECEVVNRSETYAIFDGILTAYEIDVERTDKRRAVLWELIKKGFKR